MPHLDDVLAYLDTHRAEARERLFQWLKIESISTDPAYKSECVKAAEWLKAELASLDISADVAPTDGHPVVLGRIEGRAKKHALFYGHYDVQPVDPLNLWESQPFDPQLVTLDDGRQVIRARGAADDKGQVMTFVEACRAWKAVTGSLPIGVTFMIEGEEEDGSKHLPDFLKSHRDRLRADVALVCDTSMWDQATPQITTGLRGMVYEEVTIKAANRDLHSGLYGGGAQNPIRVLTKILGDLHDAEGRVGGVVRVREEHHLVSLRCRTVGNRAEAFEARAEGAIHQQEPGQALDVGRDLGYLVQEAPPRREARQRNPRVVVDGPARVP